MIAMAAVALVVAAGVGGGNARAEQIAATSKPAKDAMAVLDKAARSIRDPAIKKAVLDILAKPAPTFVADRAAQRQKLVDANLLDASVTVDAVFPPHERVLSFAAASGGIIGKHHGHPGGLAVHTVVNLQSARALAVEYRARYRVQLDDDVIIASTILHDAMKAWTLQFDDAGALTVQPMVAATSSHHPFIVAEVMHRGLPDALVVAVASAHEPPALDGGAKVSAFIRAGALLANRDATSALALLAKTPGIEASINHLSDHDYVLADPAYAAVDKALDDAGITDRWKKHELLARVPGLTLYGALSTGGAEAMKKLIAP
jgi:hypothetical protein